MRKRIVFFLLLLCTSFIGRVQDLANPTPNLQTLPGGSYIIAMDNTYQTNDHNSPSQRFFNLKAYGLVVHLLNNKVKVRRVIRSGKVKDAADFTGQTSMVKPTLEGFSTFRSFKAGPFVVLASDLFNVDIDRLIDNYNNNAGGISGITNPAYKVKVYKTNAALFNIDIRYDYTNFVPKACILDDGGYASIHQTYMTMAGIPTTNYATSLNTNLTTNCFTFASEPHNGNPSASVVANITNFLQAGGNFLAQCDAIYSYEALGHFQTSNGIDIMNSNASINYHNSDIGYSQYEGSFHIRQGGSVQNWRLSSGSSLVNGACHIATGPSSTPIGASVSKVLPNGTPGGVVFYLGNHSYSNDKNYNEINGIRMYMNAFLTPANTTANLNYNFVYNCGNHTIQVGATGGPPGAYSINFQVYADNGTTQGVIDGGDASIGSATINSSGGTGSVPVSVSHRGSPMLIRITPNLSCYPTITVSPNNCSFAALPNHITKFTAKRENKQLVKLQWETVNEENTYGYKIKSKTNGGWKEIGLIQKTSEPANTKNYTFTDANSYKGTSHYLVEELLYDGRKRNSETRSVDNTNTAIFIYPNPSNGNISIDVMDSNAKQVMLYDLMGRKIKQVSILGNKIVLNNLVEGFYTLHLLDQTGASLHVEKVLVSKNH